MCRTGTLSTLIEGKTDLTQYLLAIQKKQLESGGEYGSAASRSQAGGLGGAAGGGAGAGGKQAALLKSKVGAFKETEADVYAWGWGLWGQR